MVPVVMALRVTMVIWMRTLLMVWKRERWPRGSLTTGRAWVRSPSNKVSVMEIGLSSEEIACGRGGLANFLVMFLPMEGSIIWPQVGQVFIGMFVLGA